MTTLASAEATAPTTGPSPTAGAPFIHGKHRDANDSSAIIFPPRTETAVHGLITSTRSKVEDRKHRAASTASKLFNQAKSKAARADAAKLQPAPPLPAARALPKARDAITFSKTLPAGAGGLALAPMAKTQAYAALQHAANISQAAAIDTNTPAAKTVSQFLVDNVLFTKAPTPSALTSDARRATGFFNDVVGHVRCTPDNKGPWVVAMTAFLQQAGLLPFFNGESSDILAFVSSEHSRLGADDINIYESQVRAAHSLYESTIQAIKNEYDSNIANIRLAHGSAVRAYILSLIHI